MGILTVCRCARRMQLGEHLELQSTLLPPDPFLPLLQLVDNSYSTCTKRRRSFISCDLAQPAAIPTKAE